MDEITEDAGPLRVTRTGRLLELTFARPQRHNVVDQELADALVAAVAMIDDSVGAVLLLADGQNFCVGGDVAAFASADRPGELVRRLADTTHGAELALSRAGVPVVAGVQGWAAGIGMSIALIADVLVMGSSARLRSAYAGIGFSPDGGMSWTLTRAVGQARALDLILTNRPVSADEALASGLAARVVDDGDVDRVARDLATSLADGPTGAYAAAKTLIRGAAERTLAEQMSCEAETIAARSETDEGREGVRAFVERRSPRFH